MFEVEIFRVRGGGDNVENSSPNAEFEALVRVSMTDNSPEPENIGT